MADEIIAKIFKYKESTIISPEKYGYRFYKIEDNFNFSFAPFDIINIFENKRNNYFYKVEGLADDSKANIRLEYNNKIYYFNEDSNIIDLVLYEDISKFKLYINDIYIDSPLQSGLYGEIIGNVNIKNCGITNPEDIEIVCLSNDSKRLIGRYDVVNGIYKIPNLDVNKYYDIILVDKSRKVEQQVLSYRKPTPY